VTFDLKSTVYWGEKTALSLWGSQWQSKDWRDGIELRMDSSKYQQYLDANIALQVKKDKRLVSMSNPS